MYIFCIKIPVTSNYIVFIAARFDQAVRNFYFCYVIKKLFLSHLASTHHILVFVQVVI